MASLDLRTWRIGLVLSGGGAKGAYHIGCLKALRAKGLDRFDAVAGSSVGAINAVIVGSGRLDAAERAWRSLRASDVVGLRFKAIARLPGWIIAALGSEFSPFKLTRLSDRNGRSHWVHPAACAALALLVWWSRGVLPAGVAHWAGILAAVPLLLSVLTLAQRFMRPIFLQPVFTTSAPLACTLTNMISDDDVQTLRATGVPTYGVLSQHAPGVPGADRWGGWVPRYFRIDRATDAAELRRALVEGSAVPGFLEGGWLDGRRVLDGAWTDNVPAAPLLFGGHELDVIIVVYLKRVVRHTHRPNSLCAVAELLIRDAFSALRPRASLDTWARTRWQAYRSSGAATPDVPVAAVGDRRMPQILAIAPSRRIGNFFTGTLWFSRAKSAELIDLGERDTLAALESLEQAARPAPHRPRDMPAAVLRPAHALPRPRSRRVPWPSRYQPEAE